MLTFAIESPLVSSVSKHEKKKQDGTQQQKPDNGAKDGAEDDVRMLR